MNRILNDEPIESKTEDRLGRKDLAEVIASEIKDFDASRGVVIAVLGPWGSGKTSLLNMIAELLVGPPWVTVVRFNPWLFSGSGELVTRFFYELAAQLKADNRSLTGVANMLSDYGEVMAPLQSLPAVGWIFGLARSVGEIQKRRKGGVTDKKVALEYELARIDGRVIVFVDDIDRLDTPEIRDIFKLVRLTGNLPNVVYVLAFDRERVEQALDERNLSGRSYLEKIVQNTHDLPAIPRRLLRMEVTQALDVALEEFNEQYPFDTTRWPDIFQEIVYPSIRNIRDIRRYTASIRGTVKNIDGKVELSDLLALEAVRVFLPDLFRALANEENRIALTTPSTGYFPPDDARERRLSQSVQKLVDEESNKGVATALINRLFPDASRHLEGGFGSPDNRREYWKQRRVAHPNLLDFYFEHIVGAEQSALYQAERTLDHMDSSKGLAQYLRSLDGNQRIDVLNSMDYVIDDVPEQARLDVAVGLLDLFGEDANGPAGKFDLLLDGQLTKLVSMLIGQIVSEEVRNSFARQLFARVPSLSTRYALLQSIGYVETEAENPVDKETTEALAQQLKVDLASTSSTDLHVEPYLFGLLDWASKNLADGEPPTVPPESDAACTLLKQARSDSRTRLLTSRHVATTPRLNWDTLLEIVGSEQWVRDAIEYCGNQSPNDETVKTIELAEKYLGGWRPNRWN